MRLTAAFKRLYREARRTAMMENPHWDFKQIEAHDDAMEMVLHKVARIATGTYHPDNYDDVNGYSSIAKDLGAGIDR